VDKQNFPYFELRISSSIDNGIYVEPISCDNEGITSSIVLDVRHLCKVICNAAKEYYKEHEPKTDFKPHHIDIVDVEDFFKMNTDR